MADFDDFGEEAINISNATDRLEGAINKATNLIDAQQRLIETLLHFDHRQDGRDEYLNQFAQFHRDSQDLQESLADIARAPERSRMNVFMAEALELDELQAQLEALYRRLGDDGSFNTLDLPSLTIDVNYDGDDIKDLPSGSRVFVCTIEELIQRLRALSREKQNLLAAVCDKESYIMRFRRDFMQKYEERVLEQRDLVERLRNIMDALDARRILVPRRDLSDTIMRRVPSPPRQQEADTIVFSDAVISQIVPSPPRQQQAAENIVVSDAIISRLEDDVKCGGENIIELMNQCNLALANSTNPRRSDEEKRETFGYFDCQLAALRQTLLDMREKHRAVDEACRRRPDAYHMLAKLVDMKRQRYKFMQHHLSQQFERLKTFVYEAMNTASDNAICQRLEEEINFMKMIIHYADSPSEEDREREMFASITSAKEIERSMQRPKLYQYVAEDDTGYRSNVGRRKRPDFFQIPPYPAEEIERAAYPSPRVVPFQPRASPTGIEVPREIGLTKSQQDFEDELRRMEGTDFDLEEEEENGEEEETTVAELVPEDDNTPQESTQEVDAESSQIAPGDDDETARHEHEVEMSYEATPDDSTYVEEPPEVYEPETESQDVEYQPETTEPPQTVPQVVPRDRRQILEDEARERARRAREADLDYARNRELYERNQPYATSTPVVQRRPVTNVQRRPVMNVRRGIRRNLRPGPGMNMQRRRFDPKLPYDEDVIKFDQPLTKH